MTPQTETVDHPTLQRMHAAGVVTDATLVAEAEGWAFVIQVRRTQYPLVARRGGIRHWAKMESAVRYLRDELGITDFRVDARGYDAETIRSSRARPDAAAKLTKAHEAAAHDAWVREQVQAAIEEADSPDAVWYTHEEVMREAGARLEARIKQADSREA